MRKLFALIILLTTLISCNSKTIVVLVDPWWETAFDKNNSLKKEILYQNRIMGNKIEKITVLNETELRILLNNCIDNQIDHCDIVLTPYLFALVKNDFALEKKINYIILNGFYDSNADNVIAVYSDRIEIYYEAGRRAAQFSLDNENCSVASLFYIGTDTGKLEKESFVKGFISLADEEKLLIHQQKDYRIDDNLKSFVNRISNGDTQLFFLSASSANSYCLELILPLSFAFSGENLYASGIINELLIFSLEDNIEKIVKTAIEIGLDGDKNGDFPVKALIKEKGIHF